MASKKHASYAQLREGKASTRAVERTSSPDRGKTKVPLDIAVSLLRQDELEKLKKYITSYLMKCND